ncbi:hypothetical protein [Humibacter sp. RRB41]|uniref:hypothetical protein n=1 Tax=Humibacter sp. RRB41 TaxID=2919946 RepID=UPI001FA974C0|nr:hypothetical protein [Humibacter sp. RRB41]
MHDRPARMVMIDAHQHVWDLRRSPQPLPFEGSWFPDAFVGSMGVLQRYLEGSIATLPTSVDDVQHTMAIVEAAYDSNERGGVVPHNLN